uniref:Uncharacterized protein n=1 Tax=Rhizophora mucronata TaxID=61149 RepID=A0A2P2M5J8_RHIMU
MEKTSPDIICSCIERDKRTSRSTQKPNSKLSEEVHKQHKSFSKHKQLKTLVYSNKYVTLPSSSGKGQEKLQTPLQTRTNLKPQLSTHALESTSPKTSFGLFPQRSGFPFV